MNIFVTGGNSPLGSFFIRRLLDTFPNCSILTLSRTLLDISDERLKVLSFDLASDIFSLSNEFDIVIHAAAAVPNNVKDLSELSAVNLIGSSNLFKRIKLSSNPLVINISSSSVYEDPFSDELFENSWKTSKNHYGLSKLNFEFFLINYYKSTNVKLLSLRLPVVLVKNVKNNFIAQWLNLIQNEKPIILSNPDSLFNACIYSEDIFQFILKYSKKQITKNLTCNLSCKNPIKVIDVANLMIKNLNSSVDILEKKSNKKSQLFSFDLASINGFEPRSVEDSIRLFISE
jgi:nucleoside-diphosphate-sugar epimerase